MFDKKYQPSLTSTVCPFYVLFAALPNNLIGDISLYGEN